MVQKITIQGITISHYTAYEEIRRAEEFLNENAMHTIGTITMRRIASASKDEVVKRCLNNLDLAVIGETQVLKAGKVDSPQRIREVRDHTFIHEFLTRLARTDRSVFLLAENEEKLERLRTYLSEEQESIKILGDYVLEDSFGDPDRIVNEINAAAPDVVLSVIDSPEAEYFLAEQGSKLGVRLWYGIGDFEKMHKKIGFFSSLFRRFALK